MTNILKSFFVLAGASILAAGCSKESNSVSAENESDMIKVGVVAGLEEGSTKAVSDRDGNGKKVNHWIMEVRDESGNVYTREERDNVQEGTKTQTFSVTLVKGNSYTFQFWADTKGSYKTDSLTCVTPVDTVANKDTRDAFSANKAYQPSDGKSISATLTRPFAQLNIQSTDLGDLWTTTKGEVSRKAYDRFEPKDLKVSITVPKSFNVKTQKVGADTSLVLASEFVHTAYQSDSTTLESHNNYYNHVNPATFFMGYVFASTEKNVYDITFSFKTNDKSVKHNFTSIPLQRNYRTNIKGAMLTDNTEWTVTIDPVWNQPDYEKKPSGF